MDANSTDDTRLTRAIIGALREHDLSGFEVLQWLGPVPYASGVFAEPAVFPTLHSLEERRLIAAKWRDGSEGTRRRYRVTARGLALADREGWGPVAFERFGATRYGARDGEAAAMAGRRRGLDSGDTGGWVWPVAAGAAPAVSVADATEAPAAIEATAVGTVTQAAPETGVEAYLHSLQTALTLAPTYCSDVCHEVSDYISDATARLALLGSAPDDAAAEVLEALGSPTELAQHINAAQLTQSRLRSGMSWGSAVATLTFVVVFAITFDAMVLLTPWIIGLLTPLLADVGLHVYAPMTAEWDSQMTAVALAVGAFVGARRSMPFVADRSRQADTVVWRAWSLAGGLPLLILALVLPFALDPLTALLMLAPPLAWVLGTRRPAVLYGPTMTARGFGLCVAAMFLLNFLPGGRIWFYSAGQTSAADSVPRGDATATVTWNDFNTGATVSGLPAGWHDPTVNLVPAVKIGPVMAPDPNASKPVVSVPSGGFIDFQALPRTQIDWWTTANAVAPDGRRYVVYGGPHFGYPTPIHASIIGWLIGLP
jgi:DNA-binding PadR family transcriptional regulator